MAGWAALMFVAFAASGLSQPTSCGNLALKRVVSLEYPWLARVARLGGKVELAATISSDGSVERIRTVSGAPLLALPAREALAKWRFAGFHESSGCEARIVFVFELTGSCDAGTHCPSDFEADLAAGKVTIRAKAINAMVN